MSHQSSFMTSRAVLGWFLIALFYCYQYILRVVPGVISDELRHTFHMTAEQFSSLGAACLYAYALLQIPIGYIVDRIGIKRTLLVSILLCIVGTFWLTQTNSLWEAKVSRILVGAGSACAFMSPLKWVADHFEPGKRGLLMGATLTLGTVGALSAGYPFISIVDTWGWQNALIAICTLGGFLFLLTMFLLKEESKPTQHSEKKDGFDIRKILVDLKSIACNKSIVVYALLAVGVYTPLAVLADLWGVSFLVEKFAMSRSDAASTTMLMYIGLAVGSLTLPALAERHNIFARTIQACSLGLLVLFGVLLTIDQISLFSLRCFFISIGIFCGAEMICFSGAVVGASPRISGLTLGFVNTMNMLTGAVLQQAIGFSLDWQWSGNLDSMGIRVYTADQYVLALAILPAVLVGCVLLSLTLKKENLATSRA